MAIDQKLANRAKARAMHQIAIIKSAPADSRIAKANAKLVADGNGTYCGGMLSVAGLYWFSADVDAMLFSTGDAYTFDGSGTGWIAGIGDCAVAGYFVVAPNSLAGPANFNLTFGAVESGAVEIDFYLPNGNFMGSMAGYVEGAGGASVSGGGTFYGS